ncbi:hypothetical protein N7478_002674 [Penicillium angulare]|uniref:uncharacterized protein n=1 Tax=Penicillium angulare TaxID=116970 RepID=UPI0025413DF4|nr:uncharacterized protein N7478_002674 [Penicillium angulare]KAJ5286988.1 hypothetical protein N7478_002674 [Penicillium angulare]
MSYMLPPIAGPTTDAHVIAVVVRPMAFPIRSVGTLSTIIASPTTNVAAEDSPCRPKVMISRGSDRENANIPSAEPSSANPIVKESL